MAAIFFSYSHADEAMRDRLQKHLTLMKHEHLIDFWHDRRISAGSDLDGEISESLDQADLILLLVSADFIASNYCYSKEMTHAMKRHEEGTAKVIPVILHPCDWHSAPFGKLLAAPKDGKPISTWANLEEGYLDVAKQIRSALQASARLPERSTSLRNRPNLGATHNPTTSTASSVRSSNMSIRKRFSDLDRDHFEQSAFEFLAQYFENSLQELQVRHADQAIHTRFSKGDQVFRAYIYQDGQSVSECSIRLTRNFGRGIAYSSNGAANDGSLNDQLSVEADDQMLYLKPLMAFGPHERAKLSVQGAAEFYWEKLIEPLQQ